MIFGWYAHEWFWELTVFGWRIQIARKRPPRGTDIALFGIWRRGSR